MKNLAWIIILGLAAVLLTDCIIAYPTVPPPALRVEVILTRPGPAYVWITGYWGWGGGGYHWVPGHWVKARRGRAWTDGRWEQRGRKWVWRRGHWK